MDRKVYREVSKMPEHHKFFRGIVAWTGFRQTGIPIKRANRFAGESKAELRTLVSVAVNGIIAFSYIPLRINWILTVMLFFLSFIFFINKDYIVSLFLFLFFVVSLQLSVFSEYFIRVIEESRGRPNFIVNDKIGLD
jgi:dolichol-phosphate mannosyltransferase